MTDLMTAAEIEEHFAKSIAILSPAQDAVMLDMWGENPSTPIGALMLEDIERMKVAYFHMFRYWTHAERDPLDTEHFKAFLGGFIAGLPCHRKEVTA